LARRHRLTRLLVLAALAAVVQAACGGGEAPPDLPNIVMIIGDDHGWPYAGFMGDAVVKTPHLDALADEGIVFTTGYNTASSCRPSLRSLLTGLHPLQWRARRQELRAEGRGEPGVERIRDFATLPRLLGTRGYASFQGGKYWEGSYAGGGFTAGMATLTEPVPRGSPAWALNRAGGSSLELGRSTLQPLWDFLEEQRERPFLVWYAPKLPHTPHDAGAEFAAQYADLPLSEAARAYYANITRLDATVGEIVAKLEQLGLRDDTLLVYLSDNGWQQGPREPNPVKALGGPKGKSSMYELGFRTPVVFNWPGRLEGPLRRDDLVDAVDVFATLLDFAGVEPPRDVEGVSLRPVLEGGGSSPRRAIIGSMISLRPPRSGEPAAASPEPLVRTERAYFLRDATWHYIWYAQHAQFGDRRPEELYKIAEDPWEEKDVAGEHPELVGRFRADIERWLEGVNGTPQPGF
jgi:arylsulfatase A-like enzyme